MAGGVVSSSLHLYNGVVETVGPLNSCNVRKVVNEVSGVTLNTLPLEDVGYAGARVHHGGNACFGTYVFGDGGTGRGTVNVL